MDLYAEMGVLPELLFRVGKASCFTVKEEEPDAVSAI